MIKQRIRNKKGLLLITKFPLFIGNQSFSIPNHNFYFSDKALFTCIKGRMKGSDTTRDNFFLPFFIISAFAFCQGYICICSLEVTGSHSLCFVGFARPQVSKQQTTAHLRRMNCIRWFSDERHCSNCSIVES